MLKTESQARDYAAKIESLTGEKHHVFRVAKGTAAYAMGYRFGTCSHGERAEYAAGGAVFL
jgi:hypothetical protein